MVFHHSIPFGAPSQLRLHLAVDAQGMARLTILDAFDQPLGGYKNLPVSLAELAALADGGSNPVNAQGGGALITVKPGHDQAHEFFDIHYEDPDRWSQGESKVVIDDFKALIADARAAGAPA